MEIKPLNQCIMHGCYSEATKAGLCSAHYVEHHRPSQRPVNEDIVRQAQEMIRQKAKEIPDLGKPVSEFHDRRNTDQRMSFKYPKYYKEIPSGVKELDIYMVCHIFRVEDYSGAIHHAIKKLLLPGVRTGGKSRRDDIKEARDTLTRWLEINQ